MGLASHLLYTRCFSAHHKNGPYIAICVLLSIFEVPNNDTNTIFHMHKLQSIPNTDLKLDHKVLHSAYSTSLEDDCRFGMQGSFYYSIKNGGQENHESIAPIARRLVGGACVS
jgi:hypothetical protein